MGRSDNIESDYILDNEDLDFDNCNATIEIIKKEDNINPLIKIEGTESSLFILYAYLTDTLIRLTDLDTIKQAFEMGCQIAEDNEKGGKKILC